MKIRYKLPSQIIMTLLLICFMIGQCCLHTVMGNQGECFNYVKLSVDGKPVFTSSPARILENNHISVPLEDLAESLGAGIEWQGQTQAVAVVYGDKTVVFTMGTKFVLVNGHVALLEQPAQFLDGQIHIPLRFLVEILDLGIEWDSVSRTAFITSEQEEMLEDLQHNGNNISVLMYHEIGDGANSLYVSKNEFRRQVKYLYDNQYSVITMEDAVQLLYKEKIPPKTVVITFDDGYSSFYTKAWPVLKEYGYPATVYVIGAGWEGNTAFMNWKQIAEIEANWIEIGSHTMYHHSLPGLSSTQLLYEVTGSKQYIENHLGRVVNTFCYPAGRYDARVVQAVKDAGYTAAVTTAFGVASSNDEHYELPRIRIYRNMSMEQFASSVCRGDGVVDTKPSS